MLSISKKTSLLSYAIFIMHTAIQPIAFDLQQNLPPEPEEAAAFFEYILEELSTGPTTDDLINAINKNNKYPSIQVALLIALSSKVAKKLEKTLENIESKPRKQLRENFEHEVCECLFSNVSSAQLADKIKKASSGTKQQFIFYSAFGCKRTYTDDFDTYLRQNNIEKKDA